MNGCLSTRMVSKIMDIALSKIISIKELTTSMCSFFATESVFIGDDDSPYWSIIWDDGIAYLADDSDSLFGDGEGGKVKKIKKLDIDLDKISKKIGLTI